MDEEDTILLEKYSKDTEDWSRVSEDGKINKDIENICWSILGAANYFIIRFDKQDVLDITGDEVY